jgi:hypothetical protein
MEAARMVGYFVGIWRAVQMRLSRGEWIGSENTLELLV